MNNQTPNMDYTLSRRKATYFSRNFMF